MAKLNSEKWRNYAFTKKKKFDRIDSRSMSKYKFASRNFQLFRNSIFLKFLEKRFVLDLIAIVPFLYLLLIKFVLIRKDYSLFAKLSLNTVVRDINGSFLIKLAKYVRLAKSVRSSDSFLGEI